MLEVEDRAMRCDPEANAKVECVSAAAESGAKVKKDGASPHERGAKLHEGGVRLHEGGSRLREVREGFNEEGVRVDGDAWREDLEGACANGCDNRGVHLRIVTFNA